MKKTNSLIITMILYLQLVLTRVSLPLASAQKTNKTFSSKEDKKFLASLLGLSGITYTVKLYTRHTGKFVRISPNKINALALKDDKYAELLLTTQNFHGHLSIQGKHSKKFICMSNKGRIILEENFDKQLCTFKMIFHNQTSYYTFQSVNNGKRFLGFKQNGENELAISEFIQNIVETLNSYFKNVTEMHIMCHLDKVHMILDEMIMNGDIVEPRKRTVLAMMGVIDGKT